MPFKVKLTLIQVNGRCVQGHKVGDEIIFDGPKIIGNLCPDVMCEAYLKVYAMRYGLRFPWGIFRFPCPNIENRVIFEIETIGLTTEPFYQEVPASLLKIIEGDPGIHVSELLN